MKTATLKQLVAIALLGAALVVGPIKAFANDEHHPEGAAKEETQKKAEPSSGHDVGGMGMMGKMDMGQMHTMMGECMKTHKNGKMCDHDMMDKCQKQQGKDACMKMMNEMKTKAKTENK
ncbi:MAG TPA: hypothetical protein PLJ21_01385 [Pseudobdellovibrionaceae bacterium]|nr:hypothetical protein [Pseudobdellovibrionaceae bacterium]